jgi:NADH-quinone oxidoreductase subunit E
MEMWLGMMTGFARASREMIAPHVGSRSCELDEAASKIEAGRDAEVVELSTRRKKATASARKRAADVRPAHPVSGMRAPKAMERPKDVDDLKRITGIGPKLEQVLNGFGIWTFEQIAALQVEEIAWLDDALGLNGRIEADNWLGQAGALGRAATRNKDVAAG